MKFIKIQNYAAIEGVSEQAINERCQKHELKSIKLSAALQKLIVQNEGDQKTFIISLANMKGGVSKTATAAHLAYLLSNYFPTILIDTDHQNHTRHYFQIENQSKNLSNIIMGDPIEECVYTYPKTGLDILPSSFDLAIISRDLKDRFWIKTIIERLLEYKHYTFVVIDTAPAYDIIVEGVLLSSSNVIIPLIPEPLNISGVNHNFKVMQQLKIPTSTVTGVLLSRVNTRFRIHQIYIEELQENLKELMFDSIIPESAYFLNCVAEGKTIFEYREKSPAAQSFKKFVWELLQRL